MPSASDSVMPGDDTPAHSPAAAQADLDALAERLGRGFLGGGLPGGHATAVVARDSYAAAAECLRGRGYNLLLSVTAVDYLPAQPRFQVVAHFARVPPRLLAGEPTPDAGDPLRRLRVKAAVGEDDPVIDSLTGLYPTANWHEREVWDLFGIEFAGHPDLRRILLPEDYEGHPLRKDHGIEYEEVAFSHNAAAIASRKPRATE
jgi:NADH-quinone oxidoreductase subunit C